MDPYGNMTEDAKRQIDAVIAHYLKSGLLERIDPKDVKAINEVFLLVKKTGNPRLIANLI